MSRNTAFNGRELEASIRKLPKGAAQMAAYQDAIHQADLAEDHEWRLMFRYHYACEATFRDDPPKAMPMAVQFGAIFEEHPHALPEEAGAETYLMITQMAIDPIVNLPQISVAQWEALMEQFHTLVKRYHIGLRTYWWQMCRFYQYVDKDKTSAYFQKFWKAVRDGLSDCRTCERSYAVRINLLVGDSKAADEYAKPMEQGRMRFCSDTPHLHWLAYLEDALDRGDLGEARPWANALYRKGDRDKSDLSYMGAVLRCWAFTDLDRAAGLLANRLEWTIGMWDQKKVYDFYKGAWCCCVMLAKRGGTVSLSLPQQFPLFRDNGFYDPGQLADWFFEQAAEIGARFDRRNGSGFFAEDLEKAGKWLLEAVPQEEIPVDASGSLQTGEASPPAKEQSQPAANRIQPAEAKQMEELQALIGRAEGGGTEAQHQLALAYYLGRDGVEQDSEKAFYWFS